MHARGNDFRELTRFGRHNSLGLYYGMLTQYLGYQMTNDEYKVMGLSSYGSPSYLEEFASILRPDGMSYQLDGELDKRLRDKEIYTSDFSTRQERIFTEKLEDLLGARRLRGQPLDDRFTDIAASGQKQLEIIATHVTRAAIEASGCADVCLAGGVALNCKMNMEIAAEPSVGRLYVPPVPHDAGVALGAAMLKCAEAGYEIAPLTHAFWGPEYSNDLIKETLDKIGARYEVLDDPVAPLCRRPCRSKDRRLVPGPYGVRTARARQSVDHRRSPFSEHEGSDQHRHQISRGISSILPFSAVRPAGGLFSRTHLTRRSWW